MPNTPWRASPILGVPRVRLAAEYYRDTLGFDLDPVEGVFQPSPSDLDGVYAIVKRAGIWIHFQIRRDFAAKHNRSAIERDVYLVVDQLDSVYADLQQRGANILQPPQEAPYGFREVVVDDLNGYRLVFGELLP